MSWRGERQHDQIFIQMNGSHRKASDRVQRVGGMIAPMIDHPAIPAIGKSIAQTQETTMLFKTLSAAVLAGSLLAAPAMAGTVVIKSGHAPMTHSFANANNKVVVIKKHRHHRAHRHVVVNKKVVVAPHRHVVKKKVVMAPGHRTVIVKKKI